MREGQGSGVRNWLCLWQEGWNRFWFVPRSPATLAVMRICTGMMLFYTHGVWTLELDSFLGLHGIFESQFANEVNGHSPFVWTHFAWIDHPAWFWGTHYFALAVMLAFAFGFKTRVSGVLSVLFAISYAHRAGGAMFGLDQINCFLALYLAISPCGALYSLDSFLAQKGEGANTNREIPNSVMVTLATRLIQLHLCVVYLFAGMGKLQGPAWWDGTAIWGAIASHEYQTIDLTFLSHWPLLINVITLAALAWECSYPFMVWPRLTRPIWLLMAVAVHLGIGLFMGMMTFGIIMVVANLAFIEPAHTSRFIEHCVSRAQTRVE